MIVEGWRKEAINLAAIAYAQARQGWWDDASRTTEKAAALGERVAGDVAAAGAAAVQIVLICWCDYFIDHATDGGGAATMAGDREIDFVNADTGVSQKEPDVPVHIRWAVRLIRARVEHDRTRWNDTLDELPVGNIGDYVMAVLTVVATTANGTPRGYARVGRPGWIGRNG